MRVINYPWIFTDDQSYKKIVYFLTRNIANDITYLWKLPKHVYEDNLFIYFLQMIFLNFFTGLGLSVDTYYVLHFLYAIDN